MKPEGLSGREQPEARQASPDDLALLKTAETVNREPGIKNKCLARH